MQVICLTWMCVLCAAASSRGAEGPPSPSQEQLNFFETKIRPVLVEHCYECHAAGARIVQGGLIIATG